MQILDEFGGVVYFRSTENLKAGVVALEYTLYSYVNLNSFQKENTIVVTNIFFFKIEKTWICTVLH
jgi:hypothetical protein